MVDYQSRDTRIDGDGEAASDEQSPDQDDGGESDHDAGERAQQPESHEERAHDHGTSDERAHDHGAHEEHGHEHHAHDKTELGVGVVTITSTRSLDDDPSGDAIEEILESPGNTIVTRELVRDSRDVIQSTVDNLVQRDDVDLVVTTGGTGVSPDDVTVEAVRPLFEKDLPGFGEVFRAESYDEIGTKVVGTRATAGIANGVPVFVLPGSKNAVTLATAEIILPEAGHLAGLATRDRNEDEE
ncbi:Molybdopterin biosynthesis enzyme [Halanaeroarchaeum sp. HSR-CO]|uniref:MogA/MoaB family molybdenum cofactor biosynthesis protein n=1 Tax=Halanaeroarchaeum sp. HSR-CO TaxID=2866382 RepID=UPI00217CCCA2|nr:MogA/MoaB family molybdenum cofactor biosynthesis protein [Halanaeroarchaeum sp. HSR-CO]UWG48769.1 Molybdopterin biosynthesis enzyme [Halanaeroarchaeum sp. HSR-CO]